MIGKLGIVGGMGPLASAAFVNSIYELNLHLGQSEQGFPRCMLYSDPTFPDRTQAILTGQDSELIRHLSEALKYLSNLGCDKIVICCVTCHYFLPKISEALTERVLSLVDILIEGVIERKQKTLVLCTEGTSRTKVIQNHIAWDIINPYIIFPDEEDQALVHEMIYQIKLGNISESLDRLDIFSQKYSTNSFIAGCTEIHILARALTSRIQSDYYIEDPLLRLASKFDAYLNLDILPFSLNVSQQSSAT